MRTKIDALDPADQGMWAKSLRANDLGHPAWLALNERRHRVRHAYAAFFRDWDVLICPAFGMPALTHQQGGETVDRTLSVGGRTIPYNLQMFWPGITCAFHLPATAAPMGLTKAGLPIGCQIVGPLYADRTTVAVARLLETRWHGFKAPPDFA